MIHQCLSDILNLKRLPLGELGFFYGGLSGKSKEDFEDGNGRFVPYMNVFSNFSVDINNLGEVNVEEDEHQNKIEYGDVLFTGSSETPDECGMSSVMLDKVEDDSPIYLNSFCFGFRFNDLSQIYPAFYKHLFRSNKIRKEIGKTANGVTRFNITKKLFAKILIPLPSLEQQREIAGKLDLFTSLIFKLNEEIELRKKQFEYYRDNLLNIDGVDMKAISDVAKNYTGLTYKPENVYENGTLVLRSSNIVDETLVFDDNVFVQMDKIPERAIVRENDLLICVRNGSKRLVGKSALIPKEAEGMAFGAFMTILRSIDVDSKYLFYAWQSSKVRKQYKGDESMPIAQITAKDFQRIFIPVPSKSRQKEIVDTLDSFTSLISKLQVERDLRQKQYEYYREKLLTFE